MHGFQTDFYGYHLKTLVLGHIRPELDYTSRGKSSLVMLLIKPLTILLQRH